MQKAGLTVRIPAFLLIALLAQRMVIPIRTSIS